MYRRALFPGRFQPFHNGHMHAVNYILSLAKEAVIVITAAQFNYLPDEPFTAGERVEMIRRALDDLYPRCYVIPVDNVANNAEWLPRIENRAPSFEAVFTNNPLVRVLALEKGYKVEKIPFKSREVLEGRKIREAMASGRQWEQLVPPAVAHYIKTIRGDSRIRMLFETEPIPLPEE